VTAAALRNDLNEARRELNTLASPDRAAAQEWLGKADAVKREAFLKERKQLLTMQKPALEVVESPIFS